MIEGLPLYISLLFGMTVIGAIVWFTVASKSKTFLFVALAWALLQSVLAMKGIFQDTSSMPPRIMALGVLPPLALILSLFMSDQGKAFIDNLKLQVLTLFHSIRIVVEVVLVLLLHQGLVSSYMTFEGANFDILSGITAPLVAWVAYRKGVPNRKLLLSWNILCLLLLLNIVVISAFAIPSPFQKISIEQPNVAVLYFPFILLPTVVVPIVLFAHLAAIRQLIRKK